MFAGPNGSGKTTIKAKVANRFPRIFGIYINPDEIEKQIRLNGRFNFGKFKVKTSEAEIIPFLKNAGQIKKANAEVEIDRLKFRKNSLVFGDVKVNSYHVSAIADFLHEKLVDAGKTFTFETVMSYKGKIALLKRARAAGYRTYLYYVATESPEINLERVRIRVDEGGHSVAPGKIEHRYPKSLDNLLDAIKVSNRAFIFDNSWKDAFLFVEITDANDFKFEGGEVPMWFEKYVLDKLGIVLPKSDMTK
jgi:predicted ABC-type ATPase